MPQLSTHRVGEFRRFLSASFSKSCPTFARSLKLRYNIHNRHCQVIFKCLCSHVATPESQRQCSPSTPAGSVLPCLPPLGHGLPLGVTIILPSRFKSYVSNSNKNFLGELSQSVGTGWVHNSPPLSSGCSLFSSHLSSLLCFILEARFKCTIINLASVLLLDTLDWVPLLPCLFHAVQPWAPWCSDIFAH